MTSILDPKFQYTPADRTDIGKRFRKDELETNLAILAEIRDFIEGYSDVVDGQDGPRPNTAMNLLRELDAMVARLNER